MFEGLIELSHSKNENIRLQAIREFLDRMLGKAVAIVESSHTRVDVGALYLRALQEVNATKPSKIGD